MVTEFCHLLGHFVSSGPLGGSQNTINSSFFPNYIATNSLKALYNSFTVKKFTFGYFYLKF